MFNIIRHLFSKKDNSLLVALIHDGAALIDVRSPAEYAGGHVKGSVNIPLDRLPAQLALLKGKKQIIVFCRSGNRSGQAKSFLEQQGFANVTNGRTWQEVNKLVTSK